MSFYCLDENSPKIKQPKGLNVILRPHQLTSIAAMSELEKQGSVIINNPAVGSGLYNCVRNSVTDTEEFTNGTFILNTNYAILADKVGAGKTYTTYGLILHNNVPESHNRYVSGTNYFSIQLISYKETTPVNLVIVPHNLAIQWAEFGDNTGVKYLKLNSKKDFDIFFDTCHVKTQTFGSEYTYYKIAKGTVPSSKIAPSKNKKSGSKVSKKPAASKTTYIKYTINKKKIARALTKYQMIILNINRYNLFRQIFRSIKWARVIIDEMDSVNVPATFDEYGNFNWFLTATPTAIYHNSCRRYVNRLFGYNHNILQYFIVKNKEEYVEKSIILPKAHAFVVKTLLHRIVNAIQTLIPQDVMNLINSGNMKEAISKLNCDIDTEENIVEVLTKKTKNELHNLKQELKYVHTLKVNDVEAHEKKIEKLENDIARCKDKINLINERVASIKKECCFICADEFVSPTILDCCKNVFCLKCLVSALKMGNNKCPFCKTHIKSNKEYHVIGEKENKSKKLIIKKDPSNKNALRFDALDKADALEHILKYISKNDPTPRILIFSDFAETFEKIRSNIDRANLTRELLSGIPSHINNVIKSFEEGSVNVLMLDSKHYGSGLNLQVANYLIFYHRMNAELETQVFGRAQRDGRKTNLKTIYLVNNNENQVVTSCEVIKNLETTHELSMLTQQLDPEPHKAKAIAPAPVPNLDESSEEVIDDAKTNVNTTKQKCEYKCVKTISPKKATKKATKKSTKKATKKPSKKVIDI